MLAMVSFLFPILMALGAGASRKSTTGEFLVGVGKADITGPAADVNLCGYEYLNQTAKGIHLRLLARTLIVSGTEEGAKRVAFVSIDTGMPSQLATKVIVETLAKKLGPGVYTERNLLISSTHTHSTPGGWQQYLLFQVSSLGFVQEAFDAVVSGVVRSVVRAHMALQPGSLSLNSGLLAGANINRSPPAYVRNPSEERKRYETVGNDTDHIMQLLRVDATDGSPLGMFNWFAVHGTSMNHSNDLLSGDNKGYASYQFERAIAAQQGRSQAFNSSDGGFVAAFASTNLGDVSPNTLGAFCQDSGLPCDPIHSTCHGKNELCIGRGPGRDQFESTQIIGQKQTDKAMDLWKTASTEVSGGVDFRHTYLRMPGLKVHLNETHSVGLCKPAMGYSFAAGTTDGPGMFNFIQSSNSSNPFWNIISHAIAKPSKEQIACQAPKPILIDSGDASWPYGWDPEIVPIQILRIGQLAILGVPGEFTTMAGRRLREAMTSTLEDEGLIPKGEAVAVVAGLSNTYASYITTFEEYQQQRYEGASTIFGPHSHQAYVQELVKLAQAMAANQSVPAGPSPPDYSSKFISLLPGVIVDEAPLGKHFGDVVTQPNVSYARGETVSVTFHSACPRNNLRQEGTFLTVELLANRTATGVDDGEWLVVADDGDWDTRFHWYRHFILSAQSFATITWDVPADAQPGTYRIRHFGDHKTILQKIKPFEGASNTFQVV